MAALSSVSFLPSSNILSAKTPPAELTLPTLSQVIQLRHISSPISTKEPSYPSQSSDVLSVVCPSLAFANTVYFQSGCYNVQVNVGEDEPEEKLISRFRREVFKANVLQECRRRRFFENKQEKRKRKTRDAAMRNRKRRPRPKAPEQNKQEIAKKEVYNDDEDNWDYVDVEVPYC